MRFLLLCFVLAAFFARADEAPDGQRPAAPADTTIVRGAIPSELVGRWLVVVQARPSFGLADQPAITADGHGFDVKQTGVQGQAPIVRTWEIARDGDQLKMTLLRAQLPEPLEKQVAKGVDAEALDAVAVQWPALSAPRPEPKTIESRLEDFTAATEEDKARIQTSGVRLLVVTTERYTPGNNLVSNASTFAVTSVERDRLAGRFAGAMLLPPQTGGTIVLPPLPIGLEGEFTAYRVGEPRSALGRILDVFRGCGR